MSKINSPAEQAQLEALRHSCEHVLTAAMLRIFGTTTILPALGPAIADGFYFDFDKPAELLISQHDFARFVKEMKKIIKAAWTFKKFTLSLAQAQDFFAANKYKLELLADLGAAGESEVSVYVLSAKDKNAALDQKTLLSYNFASAFAAGYFVDLCKGPHVANAGEIKAFTLLKVASAYWRGNEKNKQLTRIYGTAFFNQASLDAYLQAIAEAKKRDHKRIGREQDLFSLHPESPGAVFWHEKGMIIWDILENLGVQIKKKYGYIKIKTPEIARSVLWKTSGHWDHYHDDMFVFEADKETYCLKPMDCPFNILIYKTKQRSYRDLPIRYTEIGHVFRNEQSGELNGLFRVREITQDDSHLLIREDQIHQEVGNLLKMVREYYQKLGLVPEYFLSTRPDQFMGEIATWNKAEDDLRAVLAEEKISYGLKEKDGAFYGPKIDVNIKDSMGRSWQVATVQLDFQLPGRFNCEYIDRDGHKQTPVMVHAAIFGSYERMIGILLEHYAGRLPAWLSPVQAVVLPIADRHLTYAQKVCEQLQADGVRVQLDERSERLSAKIRDAQLAQVPVMVIVGDQEEKAAQVTLRYREEAQKEQSLPLSALKLTF